MVASRYIYPVKLMLRRHGDRTIAAVLGRLRCSKCRGRPAPVYLNETSQRVHGGGADPGWSIILVPEPG